MSIIKKQMNNNLYANGVRRCVKESDIFIVNSVQETSNIIKGVCQNFKRNELFMYRWCGMVCEGQQYYHCPICQRIIK